MINTTAKVRVTLDIPTKDIWGKHCTVEQIEKQARESALNILTRVLPTDIKIVELVNVAVTTIVTK